MTTSLSFRAAVIAAAAMLTLSVAIPALADTDESTYPGDPSTLVAREEDDLVATFRYRGLTRFDTARLIGEDGFHDAETVLLARGDLFPDALAGNFLAGLIQSPILLTPTDALDAATEAALEHISPQRVIILGGEAAVSQGVADALAVEYDVERAGGVDRFETAVDIASYVDAPFGEFLGTRVAIVASGENFPDALVAGAIAFGQDFPLLLTRQDSLPEVTRDWLEDFDIETVIIPGGSVAVSDAVQAEIEALDIEVERVFGPTRVDTAIALSTFAENNFGWDQTHLNIARGDVFADALTIGPHAGSEQSVLLLTDDETNAGGGLGPYLDSLGCEVRYLDIAGGEAAITTPLEDELRERATAASQDEPCELRLEPQQVSQLVGTSVTFSAVVSSQVGDPVPDGTSVHFEVWRDTDGDDLFDLVHEGDDATDDEQSFTPAEEDGRATITYEGPVSPAHDVVVACVLDVGADSCPVRGDDQAPGAGEDTQLNRSDDFGCDEAPLDLVDCADANWVNPATQLLLQPQSSTNPWDANPLTQTITANVTDAGGAPSTAFVRFEVFRNVDGDTDFDLVVVGMDPTGNDADDDFDPADEDLGEATFDYEGPAFDGSDDDGIDDVVVGCIVATTTQTCGIGVPDDEDEASDDALEDQTLLRTGVGGCDTSNDDVVDCADVAWRERTPTAVEGSPASDLNPLSTAHQVRATLTDQFLDGLAGHELRFQVFRSTDGGATFVATVDGGTDITGDQLDDDNDPVTEGPGQATFDYTGPATAALDRIVICIDVSGDGCASLVGGVITFDPEDTILITVDKEWALPDAAPPDGNYQGEVESVDTSTNELVVQVSDSLPTFTYEGTDGFTVNGVAVSSARFECAVNETIIQFATTNSITIDYQTGLTEMSSFVLETSADISGCPA